MNIYDDLCCTCIMLLVIYHQHLVKISLPETNSKSKKNGWLEYFLVSFWDARPIFRGFCYIVFGESKWNNLIHLP